MNICFIGAGNMTKSIIGGLIANDFPAKQIYAANRSTASLKFLQEKYDIHIAEDNISASRQADVLILAVKPNIVSTVCEEVKDIVHDKQPLIISIAAGKKINSIHQYFKDNSLPIVRCMPNTPSLIGCGMTGVFANQYVNAEQKILTETILKTIGQICWVTDEAELDIITAISGSGPAYFFYIFECFINAAVKQGLSKAEARVLVLQTALGASKMALQSEESIKNLRNNVTSPGGTTEKGLAVLIENQLISIIDNVVHAAKNRAEELALE